MVEENSAQNVVEANFYEDQDFVHLRVEGHDSELMSEGFTKSDSDNEENEIFLREHPPASINNNATVEMANTEGNKPVRGGKGLKSKKGKGGQQPAAALGHPPMPTEPIPCTSTGITVDAQSQIISDTIAKTMQQLME